MKTNHQRGFKAGTHRDQAMWSDDTVCEYSGKGFGASIGNDFTNGNRGMAKSKRGGKKYLRSRKRFHAKMKTNQLMQSEGHE